MAIDKGTRTMSLRTLTARAISPAMRLTGFRFSKDYRWGTTRRHRVIYRMVDTVAANYAAGMTFVIEGDKIIYKK